MVLEDEADLPVAKPRELRLGERGRVLAVEHNPAAAGRLQGADDREQGTLARSAGAEDRHVLAAFQLQRHVAEHRQRLAAGGILLGDVLDEEFLQSRKRLTIDACYSLRISNP